MNSKSGILEYIEAEELKDSQVYKAMFKNKDKTSCANYIKYQFKNLNSHLDSMRRNKKISENTQAHVKHYTNWYETRMLEDLEKLVDINDVVVTTCYHVYMYSEKVANFIMGLEEMYKPRSYMNNTQKQLAEQSIYSCIQLYLNDEDKKGYLERLSCHIGGKVIDSNYPIEYYKNNSDHMTRMIKNRQQ